MPSIARGSSDPGAVRSITNRLADAASILLTLKQDIAARRLKLGQDGGLTDVVLNLTDPLRPLGPTPRLLHVLEGHFKKVFCADWSGCGSLLSKGTNNDERLVSASQDGRLMLWNARTQQKIKAFPLKNEFVMSCAFEKRDGILIASGGLDSICTLHTQTSPLIAPTELSGHKGYISCCKFVSSGDEQIVTSSGDGTVRLWDISRATKVQSFDEHNGDVMSVSVHPSHPSLFLSGSCDSTVKLWDIRRAGRCSVSFEGHESDVNSVSFMKNGLAFASGSDDSSIRICDLRSCSSINVLHTDISAVTSLQFSSSGRILFAGYDNSSCYAWDSLLPSTKTPIFVLDKHSMRISSVSLSSGGHVVALTSWDNTISLWI
jgi:guanine nucleotide-binding protein G(I)/G(S)/G(T) subunit beta-1